MNKWFELTLKARVMSLAQEMDEALVEAGAVAVTMQDANDEPVYEPLPGETPLWRETLVTGLFETPCDVEAIKASVSQSLGEAFPPIFQMRYLEDQDWIHAWMDHYKPIKFGDNLWICPTHMDKPEPNIATVMLDPGLAFGTGTHPTTALCLEWLSDHQNDYQDESIIDYGCGSGILGIAAKLLGARVCYSVDIDPQAITATNQNAQRNGITAECHLPEDFKAGPAKVVLANILSGPLIELAPLITQLVQSKGHLVLAGLLDHDSILVKTAYQENFSFMEDKTIEGWTRLHGIKH